MVDQSNLKPVSTRDQNWGRLLFDVAHHPDVKKHWQEIKNFHESLEWIKDLFSVENIFKSAAQLKDAFENARPFAIERHPDHDVAPPGEPQNVTELVVVAKQITLDDTAASFRSAFEKQKYATHWEQFQEVVAEFETGGELYDYVVHRQTVVQLEDGATDYEVLRTYYAYRKEGSQIQQALNAGSQMLKTAENVFELGSSGWPGEPVLLACTERVVSEPNAYNTIRGLP